MTFMYNNKETAANTADCLEKWKDNLVTAGWTLYDDQSGATYPYYVMSSNGENSDNMTCYCQLTKTVTADRLYMYLFLGWNNSTHVGTCQIGAASYCYLITDDDASFDMWMSANKDEWVMVVYTASYYRLLHVGQVVPFHNKALGILQSGISSGSNVVVTLDVDEADGFEVGMQYQIVGANSEGRDPVTVAAVDPGSNQITLASVARAYGADARVGDLPWRWMTTNSVNTSAETFSLIYSGTGTTAESSYCACSYQAFSFNAQDPDSRVSGTYDYYALTPVFLFDGSSLGMLGIQHPDTLYLRMDCVTSSAHTVSVGEQDWGTSTGSNTSTTLNDTGASWTTNEWANKALIITAGTGAGQIRTISSNTSTELTVSAAWTTTPDATSEYMISDEGWMFFYLNNSTGYQGAMRCA